ncbi:hypothetical protein C8J57DRAFT_1247669 [Mycena rebaudengoi]|nr:hypothetical protein C8J57DRAFT_1247669 [Mycena rebaudengoi]
MWKFIPRVIFRRKWPQIAEGLPSGMFGFNDRFAITLGMAGLPRMRRSIRQVLPGSYSQGWSTGITGLRSGLFETAISLNNSVEGAADLGATVALNFTGSSFEVRRLLVKEFPNTAAAYSLDEGPWLDVQMPMTGSSYFNAQSNFEFIGQTFDSVETHSPASHHSSPVLFSSISSRGRRTAADFDELNRHTSYFHASSITYNQRDRDANSSWAARAIAGISIAIAACLLFVAVALFLLRRQRRRRGTTRSDITSRSVTPFAIYRDGEPSGFTRSGQSEPPMVSTNPGRARKGQRRAEPVVRMEKQETAMTEPPVYTDRSGRIVE